MATVDETRIKARDLMQVDVVKLHCRTPIARAVETLEEYSISGAPVVDEAENLVGVFSASDIVTRAHIRDDRIDPHSSEYYRLDPLEESEDDGVFSREDYDPELFGGDTVGDWMTPRLISVSPEASLGEVCTTMVREGIHRVFVVEDGRLAGIVSTFDVVKRLADPAVV